MTNRAHRLLLPFGLACAALLSPSGACASQTRTSGGTGGASLSGIPGAPPTSVFVVPGNLVISTTGDGITLRSSESGLLTQTMTFSGNAPASDAGRAVEIERAISAIPGWTAAATATIGPGGAYNASWRVTQAGRFAVRAVLPGPGSTATADVTTNGAVGLNTVTTATTAGTTPTTPSPIGGATSPSLTITVFKTSLATLYGPGFYGHKTACGQTLQRGTIGVASRTLRCGTSVTIYYKGQEMLAPVIDRGPYTNHATWDLTMATAAALGIKTTSTIGTLAPGQI